MSPVRRVDFRAMEYHTDQSVQAADYSIEGSPESGWRIRREGSDHLALGPGYRLLRVRRCGVCSTDLDRHHLPFPLPQVTGHELVAEDETGARLVVEINASHAARGRADSCPYCRAGLDHHCPERLVLGIHDLPGGFGGWVLAPVESVVALPDRIRDDVAVLIEPFAAALRGVDRIDPQSGDTVAVLGTRRLGQLMVAALAARRRAGGGSWRIVALSRHARLRALALQMGADESVSPPTTKGTAAPIADVVVDTTASPEGLPDAIALAAREVHLKSTHGRPSAGLSHLTELVVDEISLAPLGDGDLLQTSAPRGGLVAWLSAAPPPRTTMASGAAELLAFDDARVALDALADRAHRLPAADIAVVDDAPSIDSALRPRPDMERSVVRPEGEIRVRSGPAATQSPSPLVAAIARRGLRLSSSRCGDFRETLQLLGRDGELRGVLPALITHRLSASSLDEALRIARGADAIKVVVDHEAGSR